MEWLQSALYIVLMVAGAVASVYLLPWLKEKLGAEQYARLWNLVCIAVQAAEQLFPTAGGGAQKLQYVLEWLQGQGVDTHNGLARSMVEAAVRELT